MIRKQRKIYMSRRLRGMIILSVVLIGLGGGIGIGLAREGFDSSIIGPYTKILLPLEDLPALNENLVANPTMDLNENGATLQVLYVLDDPRDVPLARYAYYKEGTGVVAPTNYAVSGSDLPEYTKATEELMSHNPKTINVYVRVQAPADQQVPDPLFPRKSPYGDYDDSNLWIRYNLDRPALLISTFVQDSQALPCAVPEYIDGTEPYQLPPDLNGGEAIGSDGLYDPAAYAPPRPWYDNQNPMLEPGEVREGWVSCLAPDIPLENIEVRVWHSYMTTPDPTPTPGPSPTPLIAFDDDSSDCPVVDSFDDPVCSEAGCCILAVPTLNATEGVIMDSGFVVENYESEESINIEPVWNYYKTSYIPDEGIRLEDVGMVFINEEGNQKSASGAAFVKSANVVQSERHQFNDFLFTAEVSVEPDGLSEEDLRGFVLYRIDVDVEIYEQANSSTIVFGIKEVQNTLDSPYERFLGANFNYISLGGALQLERGKQPFANMFMHKPDSPFTGYVFGNLEAYYDDPPALYEKVWNGPIPTTLWFNIDNSAPSSGVMDSPKVRDLTRYAVKGNNIYNTSLVSSTTMCDVVECLNVQDPKDKKNEARTVPLMCPGEWANNFLVDGVVLKNLDYIGEPSGDSMTWAYMQIFDDPLVTWIIDGTILGGLSPWQSTKSLRNNIELVDLESGNILDTDSEMLPLYFNTSDSYFLPLSVYSAELGWINHDVSERNLMFSAVKKSESAISDNAILLLREGPAWDPSCTRPLTPVSASRDEYSPPLNGSSFEIFVPYHKMKFMLPGFDYPVSEPVIRTGLFLGDEGTYINGKTLIPNEVKIIPGKEGEPIYYVPQEDTYYPYKENESINNRTFFRNVDAILIPHSSSLVLVKVKRGTISRLADCSRTDEEGVHLSYPGYYPIGADKRQISGFSIYYTWVCSTVGKDEVWLVFRFPSLDFDQNQLVLSIKGEDNWNLWNLAENP